MQMVHSSRLRGVASDFTGLIEQDRIRSVQDDRSYSVDVNAAAGATPATGYIDLKQNSTIAVGDPEMLLPTEVTIRRPPLAHQVPPILRPSFCRPFRPLCRRTPRPRVEPQLPLVPAVCRAHLSPTPAAGPA